MPDNTVPQPVRPPYDTVAAKPPKAVRTGLRPQIRNPGKFIRNPANGAAEK